LLERASADLADVQAQLLQAGKLASLGTLAAGIAHELNQPLTVIMGLVDLIQEEPESTVDDQEDALERVSRAARRMSEIVNKINTYARQDAFRPRRIPAELPLCEARDLVQEVLLSQRVIFTSELEQNAGDVLADPGRMQQVFMNLIGNARDAVLSLPEEERQVRLSLVREGAAVRYEVADAGPGVPPVLVDQIFDPFFTTKDPGKGTGLGLSLSLSIVTDHGGELSYSREGGWTRFVVRLPLHDTHGSPPIARP